MFHKDSWRPDPTSIVLAIDRTGKTLSQEPAGPGHWTTRTLLRPDLPYCFAQTRPADTMHGMRLACRQG
jgi:hypothetical protein